MTQIPMSVVSLLGFSGSMDNYSEAPISKTVPIPVFNRTVTVAIAAPDWSGTYITVQCLPPGATMSSLPTGATLQIDVCQLKDLATLGTSARDDSQSYTSTWSIADGGTLDLQRNYFDVYPDSQPNLLTSLVVRMTGGGNSFDSGYLPVGPTALTYHPGFGSNFVSNGAVLVPPTTLAASGDRWNLSGKLFDAGLHWTVTLVAFPGNAS